MSDIDKHNRFAEEVYTYRATKDGKVLFYWHGKQVMILKDAKARKFLENVKGLDERAMQLVIARITGNFKHGNER
jgi:hypothetical protein